MNHHKFKEILVIEKKIYSDLRGYFFESYNKKEFNTNFYEKEFLQDNVSFSKNKGTIRGLHLQKEPSMQAKLIQVLKGSIQDIIVDLRKDSQTYGKHMSIILKDSDSKQIFIPEGFAHGFLTLENETLVMYKTSKYYDKKNEVTIRWNDKNLDIKWMITDKDIILSDKDSEGILFKDY